MLLLCLTTKCVVPFITGNATPFGDAFHCRGASIIPVVLEWFKRVGANSLVM